MNGGPPRNACCLEPMNQTLCRRMVLAEVIVALEMSSFWNACVSPKPMRSILIKGREKTWTGGKKTEDRANLRLV